MREIQAEVLMIKRTVTQPGEYVLVHDGEKARLLDGANTLACSPSGHTMLVGTKDELLDEIDRLKLDTTLISADKLQAEKEPA